MAEFPSPRSATSYITGAADALGEGVDKWQQQHNREEDIKRAEDAKKRQMHPDIQKMMRSIFQSLNDGSMTAEEAHSLTQQGLQAHRASIGSAAIPGESAQNGSAVAGQLPAAPSGDPGVTPNQTGGMPVSDAAPGTPSTGDRPVPSSQPQPQAAPPVDPGTPPIPSPRAAPAPAAAPSAGPPAGASAIAPPDLSMSPNASPGAPRGPGMGAQARQVGRNVMADQSRPSAVAPPPSVAALTAKLQGQSAIAPPSGPQARQAAPAAPAQTSRPYTEEDMNDLRSLAPLVNGIESRKVKERHDRILQDSKMDIEKFKADSRNAQTGAKLDTMMSIARARLDDAGQQRAAHMAEFIMQQEEKAREWSQKIDAIAANKKGDWQVQLLAIKSGMLKDMTSLQGQVANSLNGFDPKVQAIGQSAAAKSDALWEENTTKINELSNERKGKDWVGGGSTPVPGAPATETPPAATAAPAQAPSSTPAAKPGKKKEKVPAAQAPTTKQLMDLLQ